MKKIITFFGTFVLTFSFLISYSVNAVPINYDESTDGDLSDYPFATIPSDVLTFDVGINTVSGNANASFGSGNLDVDLTGSSLQLVSFTATLDNIVFGSSVVCPTCDFGFGSSIELFTDGNILTPSVFNRNIEFSNTSSQIITDLFDGFLPLSGDVFGIGIANLRTASNDVCGGNPIGNPDCGVSFDYELALEFASAPEPGTLTLLMLGLLGIGTRFRKHSVRY